MNNSSDNKVEKEKTRWAFCIKILFELLLIGFTGWMAFETRKMATETKKLSELELRPYITLNDIQIEIVDYTNTPRRYISWLKGSEPNIASNPEDIDRAVLAVQFRNSGKLHGYIRSKSIEAFEVSSSTSAIIKKVGDYNERTRLVPANGDSGYIFGIEMKELYGQMDSQNDLLVRYHLINYSEEVSFSREITFEVLCTQRFASCEPIGARQ